LRLRWDACNIFFEYDVLRSRDASIRSRTDIKISSFHEDSRNKDCKKVWNEPRALLRAHISQPFLFSFSPTSLDRSFFFLLFSLHLSVIPTLQGCRGGGSLWIFSFVPAMKWWTTPPSDVTPFRRAVPHLLPASYRKEEPHARFPPAVSPCEPYHRFLKLPRASGPPSVSFIKIKPSLLATDVIARRRCTRSMESLRPI